MIYCQSCGQSTEQQFRDGKLRPTCVGCGSITYFDPKLAVAVLIVDNGQVLLGRRADGSRQAGLWSFPAGFVERGEVVEQAAVREAKEEAGIDVRLGSLIGLYSSAGEPVVLAVFSGAIESGELHAGDDLVELAWFPLDPLPPLAFAHDVDILQDWIVSERR